MRNVKEKEKGKENEIKNQIFDINNIKKEIYNKKISQKKEDKKYYNKINELSQIKSINNLYKNIIFRFLLYIYFLQFLPMYLSDDIKKKKPVYIVHFTFEGSGYQTIFKNTRPSSIIINDKPEDISPSSKYYLPERQNKISIKWESPPPCAGLFKNYASIISINLSQFDTSDITDMSEMFSGCSNLESIYFGDSFNTSNVKKMDYMFNGCTQLIYLNLSRFDIRNVVSLEGMFLNDESLLSLDLSSFNTNLVTNMKKMFYNCPSLLYINMRTFVDTNANIDTIISDNIDDLIVCITNEYSPKITEYLGDFPGVKIDCNHDCFLEKTKILFEDKRCALRCIDDYIYQINNVCYKSNPLKDKNNNLYPFYPGDIEEKELTKTDKNLEKEEISHSSEIVYSEITEETDHINEIEYSDISEKNNHSDIEEKSELEKNEFLSDKIGKNENNKLFNDTIKKIEKIKKQEPIANIFYEKYFQESPQNNDELKNKDEIIRNLKEEIINGNLNLLLSDVINGTKNDFVAEFKDIVYQITTTENQKENTYKNLSTINLGSCETKLKSIYNINENSSLIILKIDYKMDGLLIPVIGYEVYHPLNNSQLDLSHCSDTNVKINIPVSIDENKVYKHDPNSDFYNDDCYAYTTENGTDIILNDRKNEFINNNLSLCENNCTFNGYDSDMKKALCECETKIKINLISEIATEENILSNKFNTSNNSSINVETMKCISLLFSKDGLLTNIGSYIMLFTLILFSFSIVIFYRCGYQLIETKMQEILSSKKKSLETYKLNVYDIKKKKKKQKKIKTKIIIKENPTKKKK
jgi:surface protein